MRQKARFKKANMALVGIEDGEGIFLCGQCKGRWKTRDELVEHFRTPLHKIEMVRKQINVLLSQLEMDLQS